MMSLRNLLIVLCVAFVMAFVSAPMTRAQGVIFGTVQNTDLSNPAAGELTWFGFLDNTDEEIRIEDNAGAGYDGLNWFDDFQNYTTEAAGNPFDFVYINASRNESFRLTGTIPNNSFEEENVVLTAVTVPATPASIAGQVDSPTQITISWDTESGLGYHVYRRESSNNGVYRRLDDPSGNLANTGVAGSSFADTTSDGSSEYVYLLIADDGNGQYSAHSEPLTVDASGSGCLCTHQADLDGDGSFMASDLNLLIDIVFFGSSATQDPACPTSRSDLDCNGQADAVDLNRIIDLLFFGGAGPCDPCLM